MIRKDRHTRYLKTKVNISKSKMRIRTAKNTVQTIVKLIVWIRDHYRLKVDDLLRSMPIKKAAINWQFSEFLATLHVNIWAAFERHVSQMMVMEEVKETIRAKPKVNVSVRLKNLLQDKTDFNLDFWGSFRNQNGPKQKELRDSWLDPNSFGLKVSYRSHQK